MSDKAAVDVGPTVTFRVLEFATLLLSTLVLIVTFIISGLSNAPNIGVFVNNTGEISDIFYTQITPAGFTFSVWGLIYVTQGLWIIYAWSFIFRPTTPRAISFVTHLFFAFTNICNITWLFVWGNLYAQYALAVIIVCLIALYGTIVSQAIFLYKQTPALSTKKKYKVDLYLTRILVLNSIALYASWVSAATQLNFVIVLQYFGNVDATTAGTVGLSILLVEIVIYFILENTILDRFARFIFIVYPLFIWAFAGSVAAHWEVEEDRQNPIFTLVLLVVCVVLFVVRIILWIVFAFIRPLAVPKTYTKV